MADLAAVVVASTKMQRSVSETFLGGFETYKRPVKGNILFSSIDELYI